MVIYVKPSKEFVRQGFDIYSEFEITVPQAVLGDEVPIKTIYGETLAKIPSGIQNGDRINLKGQGVFYLGSDSQKGNHYVTIKINIPKKISDREKTLYKELFMISKEQSGLLDRVKSALGK